MIKIKNCVVKKGVDASSPQHIPSMPNRFHNDVNLLQNDTAISETRINKVMAKFRHHRKIISKMMKTNFERNFVIAL